MLNRMPRTREWAFLVAGATVVLAASSCASPTTFIRARQAEQRLQKVIKQIAASGAPVKAMQLAKPPVPDAENAALVYQKAFAAMRFPPDDRQFATKLTRDRLSLADPAVVARAGGILKQNAKALQLIHRAAVMPRCDFRLDWTKGAELQFPQFGHLRDCSLLLALEAIMLAHRGQVDQALAVCGDGFRVVKAADEPILIGAIVQYAIIAMSSRSAERVLRDSQPSVSACRGLAQCVASIDPNGSLISALKGERGWAISIFDQIRASPDPVKAVSELPGGQGQGERPSRLPHSNSFIRWWLASDELTYLELMDRGIKEAALPYRKLVHIHPSLEETIDRLPRMPPRLITALLLPVLSRAQSSRDRAIANLKLVQIALLLKAYRAEHGGYPSSLQQLGGIKGRPPPTDPFSGKPFVYSRDGAGFLVYSWGPNLKDDGGKPGKRSDDGDIVVRCVR